MYEDVNYPVFKDQEKMLRLLVDKKANDYLEICDSLGIDKDIFLNQIEKEYQLIVDSDLSGLYYLLGVAFESVKPINIISYGSSGGAVIPIILNLTGVGINRKLKNIFGTPQKYYPELFYGLNETRLSCNPSNIRLSSDSYSLVLNNIRNILSESENWADKIDKCDLSDVFVQRSMGLMLSRMNFFESYDEYEQTSELSVEKIPLDDPETMKVFCDGSINNSGDSVRIKMVDEGLKRVIMKVQPSTVEDISYAIGLCIVNNIIPECKPTDKDIDAINIEPATSPERMELFREYLLRDSIINNDSDEFAKVRKECIRQQKFPKVHVDGIAFKYYAMAYYQVHYPKLRVGNPAHKTTDDSRVLWE